ncbi:leucine Rich repeat-containing domain protein [Teladorsagia circumcincta]|uniref:Leucine Rich repeat-containing domain protein n=1 Tax=Teladorsagia circumcincta TaxID=45464 RepID=A0A2G9UKS8_TELCI|nr:leucine Rich repeat-containing domain protein [Teladorsagia circumcincta]
MIYWLTGQVAPLPAKDSGQKPSAVLGNKFFDYRVALQSEVSYKGDKYEPRIFVISKFRIFLLNGKSPSSLKIDKSYHILNVKSLSALKDDEVAISFEEAGHKKRYVIKSPQATATALIKHILGAFLRYFPDIGSQLRSTIELTPESLYDEFSTLSEDVAAKACHSFRRTYAALCDYYDQPYREEVSWIEKLYLGGCYAGKKASDYAQAVVHALGNIKTLRRVDLGGANLIALRRSSKQAHAATINKTILDVVKLFSDESCLEELILSDARLGPHLSVLLNTLGATTSLRLLDISNNDLGHFGARILSKALQLNVSLRTIIIDNNHLGVEGLYDIATALSMNKTLTTLPYPVQDVCECLARAGCDRVRLLSAMSQMESCLERNRSPANSDFANFRINTMGVDPGNLEKWDGLGDILNSAIEETFPQRLEDMVEDFVEQVRRECKLNLQESLASLGGASGDSIQISGKAERIAVSRLKELWSDDLKRVLRGPDSIHHRPRSIIGDLHSPLGQQSWREDEPGISLDSPPQPSALVHLQKSRPRLQRRSGGHVRQQLSEDTPMSRSTDIEEEAQSTKSEDSGGAGDAVVKKHPSERAGFRAAMVPDAALLSQAVLRPAADRAMSPKPDSPLHSSAVSSPGPSSSPRVAAEADSPPPLPHRMKSLPTVAPSLPPKPASRVGLVPPTSQAVADLSESNDENANNRRSVADMARIFDR